MMRLFFLQLGYYFLLCVGYRAVSSANYLVLAVADFAIASFSYFVVRRVSANATCARDWFGFAAGGTIGSILGTWVSAQFFS